MSSEVKLVKKVKRLIARAGYPRWLHHYGPKKYELYHHLLALLIRAVCRLSYRRVVRLLDELGFDVPSYSALAKIAKRLPLLFWKQLLAATASMKSLAVAAVDGTGLSLSNPSRHYLYRVGKRTIVKCPAKLSILVETSGRKRVLAGRLRSKPRHDVLDVNYLLENTAVLPRTLVADKAYDAEERVHERCDSIGVRTCIPCKSNAKRGFYRKKNRKRFRLRTYHRRSIVEAVFSALKRCYGSSLQCRLHRTRTGELYARLIAYNTRLIYFQKEIFN